MSDMPMDGMPMAGARMLLMMPAMMLPSLVAMLWRFRRAVAAAGPARPDAITALVGAGYLFVWTALGTAIVPLANALADAPMHGPMFAVAAGGVVIVAGLLQLTRWKARQLACCREVLLSRVALPTDARGAWRYGLRLGVHCAACCAGLTAALLAVGMMDLRAMAIVTAAITLERLAPSPVAAARAVGVLGLATGVWLVLQ